VLTQVNIIWVLCGAVLILFYFILSAFLPVFWGFGHMFLGYLSQARSAEKRGSANLWQKIRAYHKFTTRGSRYFLPGTTKLTFLPSLGNLTLLFNNRIDLKSGGKNSSRGPFTPKPSTLYKYQPFNHPQRIAGSTLGQVELGNGWRE